MEPRILYSADGLSALVDPLHADSAGLDTPPVIVPDAGDHQAVPPVPEAAPEPAPTPTIATELVVIDSRVSDYQKLVDDIQSRSTTDAWFEIIVLNQIDSGISQITELLAQRQDVSAVHILSHGQDGGVEIGAGLIDGQALQQQAASLALWKAALTENADVLIYGCDVAEGSAGQAFIQELARLTGADVAASNDLTGDAALGGDWVLEYQTGYIDVSGLFDQVTPQWSGLLAISTNAVSSASTANASSLSFAHTVAAGINTELFVEVAIDGLGANVTGVTYGGQALTQVGRGTGNHAVEIWALAAPAAGLHNVTINFAGNTAATAGAITFNGVDQISPTGTFVSASGTSTAASVAVASAPGDLVLDVQYWERNLLDLLGSPSNGAGQTAVWNQSVGLDFGSSSTKAGAATVTMSGSFPFTLFPPQWEIGAVSIHAADSPVAVADVYTVNEDASLAVNWWDTDWTRRSQITLSGNNFVGATSLTDFPVLITLNSGNIDYSLTQNSGQDLRFFDADGTPLAYEIDKWNEAGVSTVWVRVPQVDTTGTDSITMYYGNASAAAGQTPAAVWNSNYGAVYHLGSSGTTMVDSTGNGFTGTATNGPVAGAAQIGDGLQFDGVNDYVNLGANKSIINGAGSVTYSTWVNPASVTGAQALISTSINNGGVSTAVSRFALEQLDANLQVIIRSDDATTMNVVTTTNPLAIGTWKYVSVTVDLVTDTVAVYVDGVLQAATATGTLPGTAFPSTNSAVVALASNDNGAGTFLNGRMDEVRIAKVAQSAEWVKAEYLNVSNSFVTVGGAVAAPATAGVLGNDSDPDSARLSAVLVSGPAHASSFTLNADGTFTYTPVANYSGPDTFTYHANDGSLNSADVTVSITVNPVNDAPADLYAVPGLPESSLTGVYGFSNPSNLGRDDAGDDPPMTLNGSPGQTTSPSGSPALDLAGGASGQFGEISGITTGGPMTFAASVKFDTTGDWQRVFDFGQINSTGTYAIYVARFAGTNDLTFTIEKDLGGGIFDVHRATAAGAIVNGNWMHFAATIDAAGNMTLYLNGAVAATDAAGVVPEVAVRTHNYVGKSNWAGDALFDGAIENFVVANGAMSASQVNALYQQTTGFTVNENSANGTVVGTVVAFDPDISDTYTFSLTNNAGGRFAIDPSNGTITVANGALLDFETASSHNIDVRVLDQTGLSRTETFTINLLNVNDAPVNALPGAQTVNEDTVLALAGLSVSDADAAAASITSTLTVSNGTLNVSLAGGASISAGSNGSNTFTLSGTQAQINAALGTLTYQGNANFNGADSLQIVTNDLGNTGPGGALSDTDTVAITVNAVNDAPVLGFVGTMGLPATDENTPSSGTPVSAILITGLFSDVDPTPSNGIAVVGVTANGTFEYSTNGLAWTSFGAVSANNALLLTSTTQVRYVPDGLNGETPNFIVRAWDRSAGVASANGAPSYVDPAGGGGSSPYSSQTATVQIGVVAVNDAPTATITPLTYAATEQVAMTLHGTGLSIADVDAGGAAVRATVAVTSGVLTAAAGTTGVTVAGSGTSTVTLDGTLTQINNLLAGSLSGTLTYNANSDTPPASTSLTLTASDLGNTGSGGTLTGVDTATINIAAVNDVPVNTVPATFAANEDVSIALSGLSIADPDAGVSTLTTTLTVNVGTLTASSGGSVTATGSGTSSITLSGTLANLNAYLAGALKPTFLASADYNGPVQLTMVTSDGLNTGTGGQIAAGALDYRFQDGFFAGPDSVPATGGITGVATSFNIGTLATTFTGSLTDYGIIYTGAMNVTTAGSYTFTVNADDQAKIYVDGVQVAFGFFGIGTGTVALSAGQHSIELRYDQQAGGAGLAASYSGPDTGAIDTPFFSAANVGRLVSPTSVGVITVGAVNDAPTATITPLTYAATEQTALTLHGTGLAIADVDAGAAAVRAAVSVVSGTLNVAAGTTGVTVGGSGTGTVTLDGTLTQINNLLAGNLSGTLTYTATSDAPPASDTLTLTASDLGNTGTGGTLTANDTATINITAVNDAPVNTVPGAQTVNEDTALAIAGLSISDADIGAASATTQLTVSSGTLNVSLAGGATIGAGANGSNTLTLSGTQAQINAALATLSYQGNLNFNGVDNLQVVTNDLGNTGSGGAQSDTDAVAITVTAINAAPVAAGAASLAPVTEDALSPSGATVSSLFGANFSDVADAGNATQNQFEGVAVRGQSVNAAQGRWQYSTNGGGSWSNFGALSDTNALGLRTTDLVRFLPGPDFNGTPTNLTVRLIDNSFAAFTGGALAGGATVDANPSGGLTPYSGTTVVLSTSISAVNDAPTATITPLTYAANEQVALTLHGTGLSIADVDAGAATVSATVSVVSGVINAAAGTTGVIITGTGTNTVTLGGTLIQINNLLAGNLSGTLTYTAASDTPTASDTLTLTASDLGNTGSGGTLTGNDTATINITAVNDAPVNLVPLHHNSAGGALVFDGVNDFVAVGPSASLSMTNTMTVEAWINPAAVPATNYIVVNKEGEYEVGILSDGTIAWAFANASPGWTWVSTGYVAPTNQWTHVSVVYDAGTITTYANGVQVHTFSGSGVIGDVYPALNDFNIGTRQNSATQVFNGLIDDVRVWNVGRTALEVSSVFDQTLAGNETGLVGYWTFDEPAGAIALDSSLLGNTGTLGGGVAASQPARVVFAVNEDSILTLSQGNGNAIVVTDVDAGAGALQITLTGTNGTVSLSGTTGLAFTTGDGTADATMTFTGTLANINTALNNLTFAPTLDFNGLANLRIVTSDLGNTGAGGALSDIDDVSITVNPVNDAPVNIVPGAQTVSEDTSLAVGGLGILDVDAGGAGITSELTVSNGALNVNLAGGASISAGANGSNSLTLSGTQAQINAALATVSYQGNSNFNGSDTLQIVTSDLGNSGAGGTLADTDSVAITVTAANDAPTVTITPVSYAATEQVALTLHGTGLSIADVDAGGAAVRATVSVASGIINAAAGTTGVTLSGSGTATVTIDGTLNQINNLLAGNLSGTLTYTAASDTPAASDTLTLTASDLGNTGTGGTLTGNDTATINITAVNDTPVNTVPGAQTVNEDTSLVFSSVNGNAITISDIDVSGNVEVTLSITNGTLTIPDTTGLTFTVGDGNADSTMTFSGTVATINARLDGLIYAPTGNYNGGANLQITTVDVPGLNGYYRFGASDPGNDASPLGLHDGSVNGATVFNDGVRGDVLSLDGDDYVQITGRFDDPANITLAAWVNLTSSDTNGAEVISLGDSVALRLDEAAGMIVVSGFFYDGTTWLFTSSGPTLAGTGWHHVAYTADTVNQIHTVYIDGAAVASQAFTGSINYALGADTFIGKHGNNANDRDFNGTIDDAAIFGRALSAQEVASLYSSGPGFDTDSVAITVNPVNDAPTATIVPVSYAANEQVALTLHGTGLSISDVDAGAAAVLTTVSVVSGVINTTAGTTGVTISGNGTNTVTLDGTLSQINNLLAGNLSATLTYTANSDTPAASDTLTLSASDLGNTGSGGTLTGNDTATINITAVNDAPTATITPLTYAATEQVALTLHGTGLAIADVDAGATAVRATVSVVSGIVNTAAGTTGVTVSGSGTNTVTLDGTLIQINNLLAGNLGGTLTYTATSDTPAASDTLTLTASDLGNTGTGGTLTGNDTATINITAVNDAPVNTVPGLQTANEDTPLAIAGLSINDADVGVAGMVTQLTVTNGVLNVSLAGGATVSAGANGSSALTLSGTRVQINAALATLSYQGNLNFNGPDTLQIITNDLGGSGTGGALSDTDTVAITVNAVNDAPSVLVPGSQTITAGSDLTLSGATAITVADLDAATVEVTLSVTNGGLTLGSITGLTFSTGNGSDDAVMVFAGTLANVNAALNGLLFKHGINPPASATINVSVTDNGSSGSGGPLTDVDAIVVTINPVGGSPIPGDAFIRGNYLEVGLGADGALGSDFGAPGGYASAGTQLAVEADSDRDGWAVYDGDFILPGSPEEGWGVTVGGITYTNNNTVAQQIAGSLGNLQTSGTVQSVDWTGAVAGVNVLTTYTVGVNDLFIDVQVRLTNSTAGTLNNLYYYRNVDPDNNFDTNGLYDTTNTIVSQGNDGGGVSLVSATQADGSYLALMAFGDNSRVTWGGFANRDATAIYNGSGLNQAGSGTVDQAISLSFQVASLAAGDSTVLQYRYYFSDRAAPAMDLDANNSSGATGANFATSYAEGAAPVRVADTDAALVDIDSANLTGLTVTIANRQDGIAEILAANTAGTGITATFNAGAGVLTLSGSDTVDHYRQVLRTITYQNTSENPDNTLRQINFTATDGTLVSNTASAFVSVSSVNDAPINTVPGPVTGNEDTPIAIAGLGIADVDGSFATTQLTVINGTLNVSLAGGATISAGSNGGSTLTLSGTQVQINAALATVSYQGNLNFNGVDSLQIVTSDLGNSGAGGILTDTDSVAISVSSVNDAPTATIAPLTYAATEQVALTLHGTGLAIADVDAGGVAVRATVSVVSGIINAAAGTTGVTVSGNGTNTVTLDGTLTQINSLLAGSLSGTLTYTANSDTPAASDTLTLTASDLGNTGTGGTLTGNDTATINITAVNDAPTATITPLTYAATEQVALTLHGTGLAIADVDAGAALVRAIVSVASGILNAAAGTTGVTISGNGTNTVTLDGTLAQINNLLAGNLSGTFTYTANSDTPSASDTLTLTASDLGNTGTGGTLTGNDTATINITAVNDAPTATISPASYAATEQVALTLHGTGLAIADVDAGVAAVRATLSVVSGIINTAAGTTGVTVSGNGTNTVTLDGTLTQINNLLGGQP